MKQRILNISFVLLLLSVPVTAQLLPNLGGQRAGISSLQFLKIAVGARGAALGEAMVAVADDPSSLYWNPAGLPLNTKNAVMVSHSAWFAGLKHDFAGGLYRLTADDVVGVSLISLASDEMERTTELQPTGTGTYFRYSDLAIGVSYGRRMTSQFSFGTTIRYVEENLDVVKVRAVLFDLGTYYAMGIGSLRFAAVVSNFGSDIEPSGEARLIDGSTVDSYQPFSPPTLFKIGVAFEPYQDETHRLTSSVQLNHPNDNAENVRLGIEYAWKGWLFARLGVKRTIGESLLGADRKSADDYSFGIGIFSALGFTDATVDYSFTHFSELGAVHRVTLGITY
jgi:hypothetical protein